MQILLKNVIPHPIAGLYDPQTFIWGKELLLQSSKKYKIFAPSGKGKSTFVNTIYGLRGDYSGEVYIDQQNVLNLTDEQISSIRQKKLSIIFQDLRLFDHLTARENIEVNMFLQGSYDESAYLNMADRFGVKKLLDKRAGLLSYGERQRVAIIRALIQPFDFLLMDEPFSHLDEENIKLACTEIERVCELNGAGFLVCSLGYDYFFSYDEELRL